MILKLLSIILNYRISKIKQIIQLHCCCSGSCALCTPSSTTIRAVCEVRGPLRNFVRTGQCQINWEYPGHRIAQVAQECQRLNVFLLKNGKVFTAYAVNPW